MSVKSDRWILQMCRESGMIKPFEARLVREVEGRRIISAGVSSYGYDLRLAPDGFRVFSPIASAEIDPKNFDENSLIEAPLRVSEDGSQYWLLPPHSYALGVTVETFNMPRNVVGLCMGKCLPGDVRVIDASTGEVVELRTFVEERRKWIGTLNGHRVTAGRVTNHIYSGVKPTYEVTTRSGRVIRATDHHPFLTFGGWLELLNLRVGDRIGVPREIPIFGNKDLPDHEADILGLLIADGQRATPGHSPCYTSGDERLRSYKSVEKFVPECVIPDSLKDRRLQETLDYIRRFPKQKSNFDTTPAIGRDLLKQVCYKHGHSMRSLGIDPNWGQSVPRHEFVKLGEIQDETGLIDIGQSHILWDTVESISLIGEEPVYDLSVPATNNFIANDFIVHNSTYARSGLIVNTTPLEPGWRGRLVLEFSNSADLPIRIYANEGIAQVTFFESDEECDTSYADRAGKYQDQVGLVTPRL